LKKYYLLTPALKTAGSQTLQSWFSHSASKKR